MTDYSVVCHINNFFTHNNNLYKDLHYLKKKINKKCAFFRSVCLCTRDKNNLKFIYIIYKYEK